jgi:hypothetical protein
MSKTWVGLVSCLFLFGSARADSPVHFTDPRLKAAVEDVLWLSDPTPTDMLELLSLDAGSCKISDLTGLEHAANLQTLKLLLNQISDLSPLSGLINLRTLVLSDNQISDLSALSGLTNLETLAFNRNQVSDLGPVSGLTNLWLLDAHDNEVSDISAVSGLVNVEVLALRENPLSDISPLSGLSNLHDLSLLDTLVSDVSPLTGLTSLRSLDLRNCPLRQEDYDVHIPQIRANNPGIFIDLDPHAGRMLSIYSTAGGSVVDPGEGEFLYAYDAFVRIEARPDPGFTFAGWSGTYPTPLNPTYITMARDYQMQATFLSLLDTLYVDDDARDDPGPENPSVSDPNEDGTTEHPFDRIQEALEVAGEGATILVESGTYRENIDFLYKSIQVIGRDPNDPTRSSRPVIEGTGSSPVVHISGGQRSQCLLTGFVITGGQGRPAGAILCQGGSPTITHCLIVGNRSTDPSGAAVYCEDSRAVLTNCTIADNYAGPNGAGLTLIDSDVTVLDSILWDNLPYEIRAEGTSVPDIRYCAVRGWWPDWGDIHANPLLARAGSWVNPNDPNEVLGSADTAAVWVAGDYHLQSQAGRWDPQTQSWVQDEVTSPAIDAGLASSPVGHEPAPNGGRVNMGVYGGTPEASKSHSLAISQ